MRGAGNFNDRVREVIITRDYHATGYDETTTLGPPLACCVSLINVAAPGERQSTGVPMGTHKLLFNRRVEQAYGKKRFVWNGKTLKPVRPVFYTEAGCSVVECEEV